MKTLLKKLGPFALGPIGVAAFGFLITPIVTHIITPDEYGRTGLFQTVQTLIYTFTLLAMHQAYAREYVLTDEDGRDPLLLNAMILPLGLSLVFSAAFLVFQNPLAEFLFGSAEETAPVYWTASSFPCLIICEFCLMRVRMGEEGLLYSALSVLPKALTLMFAVLLLLGWEQSFRSVIYAMVIAQILCSVVSGAVVLRQLPGKHSQMDRSLIARLLKYGLPLVPATMISWIYTSSDQLMLRTISGYTELGLYTAAIKIIHIISVVQSCFTTVWPPISFRWYEGRKPPLYFDLVMWAVGFLGTGLGLGLLLFKDAVALILGSKFQQSIAIFPFLLLHPVMYTMSESSYIGIPFSKKTGYNIIVSAITAGINICLNLALIPLWGGRGAAMATGLSYLAFFWARTLISRKLWRPFPLRHFVLDSLVLTGNCAAHTFLVGPAPYLISAASIAALLLANIPQIRNTWTLLRQIDG